MAESESVGVISRRSKGNPLGIDWILNQHVQNQIPLKDQGLSGKKKLAIISDLVKFDRVFDVYVVDLDLDAIFIGDVARHYLDINPRISLEFKKDAGNLWVDCVGCILKSTLYIFQESDGSSSYLDDMDSNEKNVKKYVLSSDFLNKEDKVEKLEEFESLRPMNYPKYAPVAVPTPDGEKILVFSSAIDSSHTYTCFELYDPLDNSWTLLTPPEFPLGRPCIDIRGYNFIDESRFLLETLSGRYILDLKSERKDCLEWGGPRMPTVHSIVIGDRIVIGPGVVSEIGSGVVSEIGSGDIREFTLSPLPNPCYNSYGSLRYFEPEPFITLLDLKDEDAYTLVSQVRPFISPWYKDLNKDKSVGKEAWDSYIHRAYLLIDICRTNLKTLKTTKAGTLKFTIYRGANIFTQTMFIFEPHH